MLALVPDAVTVALMEPGFTGPLDDAATAVLFTEGVAALATNGVLGDPRGASADAGHAYLAAFLDAVERQLLEASNAGQPARPAGRHH
jgi:creatinine amidohydrolase